MRLSLNTDYELNPSGLVNQGPEATTSRVARLRTQIRGVRQKKGTDRELVLTFPSRRYTTPYGQLWSDACSKTVACSHRSRAAAGISGARAGSAAATVA